MNTILVNNDWAACWVQYGVNEAQIGISLYFISPLFSTAEKKLSSFKIGVDERLCVS